MVVSSTPAVKVTVFMGVTWHLITAWPRHGRVVHWAIRGDLPESQLQGQWQQRALEHSCQT